MKLLIFTQKVDRNDVVLGFFHEWILEFSKKCQSVKVICLYKGEYDLPENVEVFSLGKEIGASKISQAVSVYKYLFRLNGSYDRVFVHMNPIYLVLCGWYFWMKNIPVYMWYVHRSVDLKLRIATFFSTKIFTSSKESFGIETSKAVYLGHGIDIDKLPNKIRLYIDGLVKIAHIGRITPIKNIETLIHAVEELKKKNLDIEVNLSGDCVTEEDRYYRANLEGLIGEKGLKNSVYFTSGVKYQDMPKMLKNTHITVNLTPTGGMDKVVLTSILLGIPVFASNTAFRDVFGEYKDIFAFNHKDHLDLAEKIIRFVNRNDKAKIMESLDKKVRENFSLGLLIKKIIEEML